MSDNATLQDALPGVPRHRSSCGIHAILASFGIWDLFIWYSVFGVMKMREKMPWKS